MKELSTQSYKGVRDFYPEDWRIQEHIFSIWKEVAERYGYEEINASPLEPAELYVAKTGEEIVNEQTYTFKDRGKREVTLRPEMTPTVARMVAGRQRELAYPLRWYSIPNLFRYEKPQRGRLREHYQLNVDLFGADTMESNLEMISLANDIMLAFGAKSKDFVIKINDRRIIDGLYESFKLKDSVRQKVSKVIDKKEKIEKEAFEKAIEELIGKKSKDFIETLESSDKLVKQLCADNECVNEVRDFIEKLKEVGIENVELSPTLMRGFDYYNGLIFEIFDADPKNKRSLFGGGRYNNLLSIFGKKEDMPAVGFGMGDVTIRDFLETHDLLPKLDTKIDIYLCQADKESGTYLYNLAQSLRHAGIKVAVDVTDRKVASQIKTADKKGIKYMACIGTQEREQGVVTLKNLETGNEQAISHTKIAQYLLDHRE